MGTGYTRQSAAEIDDGNTIQAADLEAEFDAIQAAFNASSGHSHDGTSGEGPKIALSSSVSGILAVANGGTAGIHKLNGTTAPTVNDDTGSSYAVGSLWIDTTNDLVYVCVDSSSGAAVWKRMQVQDDDLDAIAALSKTDGNIIVGDGTTWVAESGSTARTSLGLGSAAVATLIDDDSMATASSTNIPSAESVKAYVDAVSVLDAELSALASVTSAADKVPYFTGSGTASVADFTSFGRSLVDDANASAARTTLGVAIGTDVQAFDAGLTSIASLTTAGDKMLYTTGSDNYAVTDLSPFARTVLDDTTASAARTTLGVAIGSDVQAYDAELAALAGLTSAADKLPYFTGSGTAATADFTTFARSILDDADEATFKATVNLEPGTDIQAYDAGLASIAGLTTSANQMIYTTGSDTYATTSLTAFGRSILDDADEATFKATVNLEIGVDVQAYDADTLKADTDDNLTAGFTATAVDDGTKSTGTYTPTPVGGNLRRAVNNGAHTLAAPTASGDYTLVIQYTNGASAGTITLSGFSKTSGDSFTTTNGHDFFVYITKINGFTHAATQALQ